MTKKRAKFSVFCAFFANQKGYQKVKKSEDTKTVQKSPTDTVVGRVGRRRREKEW